MKQLALPQVKIAKEIDGLEMGVLSDGTAYLSMRALSKLCGAVRRGEQLPERGERRVGGR